MVFCGGFIQAFVSNLTRSALQMGKRAEGRVRKRPIEIQKLLAAILASRWFHQQSDTEIFLAPDYKQFVETLSKLLAVPGRDTKSPSQPGGIAAGCFLFLLADLWLPLPELEISLLPIFIHPWLTERFYYWDGISRYVSSLEEGISSCLSGNVLSMCIFMMEWYHCVLKRRRCCGVVKNGGFIMVFWEGLFVTR